MECTSGKILAHNSCHIDSSNNENQGRVDVEVKKTGDHSEQQGVYSKGLFAQGTILFQTVLENLLDSPNKYTLQVNEFAHLNCEACEWIMFLNHKCDSNLSVEIIENTLRLSASRCIYDGEELTFNYLLTEYDMSDSFVCSCNSTKCYREIKGFKYLSSLDRSELSPKVLPYLKSKVNL